MTNKVFALLLFVSISTSIYAQTAKERKFPLVIAFVSHCCGVPDNKPVMDFIKSFRKKYKTKAITAYKIGPVGKEGEYYLAFPLKELKNSNAKRFVDQIEKVTITPGDKGGLIFEKDFTIDSSRLSSPMGPREQILKI